MDPTELPMLDIVILATAAVSIFVGAVRGFVREAVSLAVWVAAFVVANVSSREASTLFENWVSDPALRFPLAFGAVFLATLILGNLFMRVLGMLVDATGLTGLDRTLGTLFGAARAGVLLVVLVFFAEPLFGDSGWWQASRLVPWLAGAQAETFAMLDRIAAAVAGWISV